MVVGRCGCHHMVVGRHDCMVVEFITTCAILRESSWT
jgi:hypothetical protein